MLRMKVLVVSVVLLGALIFGAAIAFLNYFGRLPDMGVWDRMSSYNVELLVFVLVVFVPLAVLSGLPLAYRWGRTISTIVNAGLAMYAVVISVGLALSVVGYAFGVLDQLAG